MKSPGDNRLVVLLKSLRTNNRFYALAEPERGYRNADAIENFPADLPLGIAYPCLEDGLNDFAVIRTTFETIDVFPDDQDLRREMMSIIDDARAHLVLRLEELRDRILAGQAHFLGTALEDFREHVLHMAVRGAVRRTLDNMMKVDVFESVAQAEKGDGMAEPMFRYEFLAPRTLPMLEAATPRVFVGHLFDDVLEAVNDRSNYECKYTFDKHVFQKFIAVMFVNYATTDPIFYGTNREDYGVSSDKDMSETPLYQAVGRALRHLERAARLEAAGDGAGPRPESTLDELHRLFHQSEPGDLGRALQDAGHTVEIPFGAAERMLLEPLTLLADAVRMLKQVEHPRAAEIRTMAVNAGQQIFRNLQALEILSPLASDPIDDALR